MYKNAFAHQLHTVINIMRSTWAFRIKFWKHFRIVLFRELYIPIRCKQKILHALNLVLSVTTGHSHRPRCLGWRRSGVVWFKIMWRIGVGHESAHRRRDQPTLIDKPTLPYCRHLHELLHFVQNLSVIIYWSELCSHWKSVGFKSENTEITEPF